MEIFYISVSLDTHTSRHHWGVIVPLGARHVSRPSRHRYIGPGVTTLGSIVQTIVNGPKAGNVVLY